MSIFINLIKCRKSRVKLIVYILKSNSDVVYDTDKSNNTALIWCAKLNKPYIMKLLLDHGANINHRDKSSFRDTAGTWCAYKGHVECLSLLLQYNLDINQQTLNDGKTLIMWAYQQRRFECFVLLVKKGCDIRKKNKYGRDITLFCKKDVIYSKVIKEHLEMMGQLIETICDEIKTIRCPNFELGLCKYIEEYY